MDIKLQQGSIVRSLSGRDAGKYFMVVSVKDGNYVYIADGRLRKLDKPKLKKVKHLKSDGAALEAIAAKLLKNQKVFDSEISSALKAYSVSSEV